MLQLGATFAIAMALIELIKWIISKFTEKDSVNKNALNNESLKAISAQLELQNSNHLNHIEQAINNGNDKVVEAITNLRIELAKAFNNK